MAISAPHWSDSQKSALVQQIIAGGLSLQQACSQYGLSIDQLREWVCVFRRSVRQAFDNQLRSTLSVQGLDVEELSRAELSGDLSDMGVTDLVQTIQMGSKDAYINITHHNLHSQLWCRAGEIVDAESGPLSGEEAFYRMACLERGKVVAHFAPCSRARRIELPTSRLFLEATRRNDLRVRLLSRIGNGAQIFVVLSHLAARHASKLTARELSVLCLFDGARSLDEVALYSDLADLDALEISVRLFERGLLVQGQQQRPAPRTTTRPPVVLTNFRASVHNSSPQPNRPPTWVLTAGAAVCSTLGAITAIAYVDVIDLESAPPSPVHSEAQDLQVADRVALAPPPLCPTGMVLIRGGTFFMGSDSSHAALDLARPAHPVTVASFCLATLEVDVEEYTSCSDQGGCDPAHSTTHFGGGHGNEQSDASKSLHGQQCNSGKLGREHHPINCVSYHQAARYCAFRGARLATEAEWEFAARGATGRLFPWGDAQPTADHVNACGKECARWHRDVGLGSELHGLMYDEDDRFAGSAPVGSFPLGSSEEGVMDLIGNVFEWTAGGLYPYGRQARVNPRGPSEADSYVIRGGSFNSGLTEFSDPALRFAMPAEARSHAVGFRCAGDPAPGVNAPPSTRSALPASTH
jgi:formylglycine-generating enzyme required for sulfatase activity/transposase-like protein